jgi:hypothetical protein
MEITQKMVEIGAKALMESVIGRALKLREVEARTITELILRAEFDAAQVVPLIWGD